jgi:hypothetical protein
MRGRLCSLKEGEKKGFFFFLKKKEAKKTFILWWLALTAVVVGSGRAALKKSLFLLCPLENPAKSPPAARASPWTHQGRAAPGPSLRCVKLLE